MLNSVFVAALKINSATSCDGYGHFLQELSTTAKDLLLLNLPFQKVGHFNNS